MSEGPDRGAGENTGLTAEELAEKYLGLTPEDISGFTAEELRELGTKLVWAKINEEKSAQIESLRRKAMKGWCKRDLWTIKDACRLLESAEFSAILTWPDVGCNGH